MQPLGSPSIFNYKHVIYLIYRTGKCWNSINITIYSLDQSQDLLCQITENQ